jgi:lipopolysaccharide export system ATP-binding protein
LNLTIHTKDLVKSYRNRTVVNHVSVEVSQGEIVGLLGPNGAGKTTTFYMVVGLIKPDEGEVFLNEDDITRMPMYKRSQQGIGYLPQEASVFRKLSVEDNIMAVLEMRKLSRKQRKEKLEELLDEFHLHHVRKNNGDSLSGGERRRTEIARALAVDPKFILLDEPFAGVDPIAVEDIQAVVARLKYKNIGILITDHNVNETLSICDRAYLLIEGKIFKHGTAEELSSDEHVRRLYLGRNFELKRKDYLLDQGKGNGRPTVNNLILSIEQIISMYDKMSEKEKEKSSSPDYDSLDEPEDLATYDYAKTLSDLQDTIQVYAKESQNEHLLEKSHTLFQQKENIRPDLDGLLQLLQEKKYQ